MRQISQQLWLLSAACALSVQQSAGPCRQGCVPEQAREMVKSIWDVVGNCAEVGSECPWREDARYRRPSKRSPGFIAVH